MSATQATPVKFIVSVHKANLDAGDPRVVLVEHPDGHLTAHESVTFPAGARVTAVRPRPYGARVAILADAVKLDD